MTVSNDHHIPFVYTYALLASLTLSIHTQTRQYNPSTLGSFVKEKVVVMKRPRGDIYGIIPLTYHKYGIQSMQPRTKTFQCRRGACALLPTEVSVPCTKKTGLSQTCVAGV